MLTDGRTHGRMDDGRKVITIAQPEHSSGELKKVQIFFGSYLVNLLSCPLKVFFFFYF